MRLHEPARRASYGIAVAGFAAFVLAGYLLPIRWTGFPATRCSRFELIRSRPR